MRYYSLKRDFENLVERKRVIKNLKALKQDLDKKIPKKVFNENVLISTWNIRDFDSNKFGHGPRTKEAFYYLSEIISSFDLIAIQEVNENLSAFQKLMYVLGPSWDYIMTDATQGRSGNGERMAFVYDTNRVSFKKIAGEIVLSQQRLINKELQFARTPFLVAFQSGWFKFKLCTVHIYYGSTSGEKLQRRIEEIESIAKTLSKRSKKHNENLVLLGDFNIVSPEHKTMKALEENGFTIPDKIKNNPSNMYETMHYDQIAFIEKPGEVIFGTKPNCAGTYNYYKKIFTSSQFKDYQSVILNLFKKKIKKKKAQLEKTTDPEKKKKIQKGIKNLNKKIATKTSQKNYYKKEWRTFQMSDHLPMWTELKINFSLSYLDKIKNS